MNRRNLLLIVIGVFAALMIFLLISSSPSGPILEQKTEQFFLVDNSISYVDIFMLKGITLDDHYFYDEEHPPVIQIEIWIPDEDAYITWHVVDITEARIQELITSEEGFTEYIVKNGSNGNSILEEIVVTEPSEYVIVFRQTNPGIGTQPYNLVINVLYWGLE